MNLWLRAALFAWEFRPEVLLPIVLAAVLYTSGWIRLRRLGHRRLASRLRLLAYLSGLLVLCLALLSFIDLLGGQLFLMHMVQHLLLTMLVPILIWSTDPFPVVVWALPSTMRRMIVGLLHSGTGARRVLTVVTRPNVAWLFYITIFLGWHDPTLYNLSLRSDWVHDLQHITFTASALLFWWHIFGAAPHLHRQPNMLLRMGYVLAAIPPTMLTGVSIAFAGRPIYSYYTTVPRFWGFAVLEDQALAGAIMWIPTNMMYILAALLVLAQGLNRMEQ